MMQDIAAKLKAKREQLGYRIEEVVEKTKVHPSAIHDIESGNFANISPAYLRGFIRLYARFLNVDIEADLKDVPSAQFIEKTQKSAPAKPLPVEPKPAVLNAPPKGEVLPNASPAPVKPVPVVTLATPRSPAYSPKVPIGYSLDDKPNLFWEKITHLPAAVKKAVVFGVIIILAMVVIAKTVPPLVQKIKTAYAEAVLKAKEHKIQTERERALRADKLIKEKSRNTRHGQNKNSGEENITTPSATIPLPAAKSKVITVSLTTKKDCFVRANVDGKILFEGVLRKGVAETWRAGKEINLKLSDGSAVIIDVNGSTIPPISSRPRAIKSLKINSQGISIVK